MLEQSLAKLAHADIVVYIGCGERGNEMTEVLDEFPRARRSAHRRAADGAHRAGREHLQHAGRRPRGLIYSGITIAEYYRDQGYHVAMMADSTSRWGEALREVSGRLEEMPAEEGYPAYLATRLAGFYERAGRGPDARQTSARVGDDRRRRLAGRR